MASTEDVWQHVTGKIQDEFALLNEKAGEVSAALATIVSAATQPIDLMVDGYVNSTFTTLRGSLPVPSGTTSSQVTGGGSGGSGGSGGGQFVRYSQPNEYAWDLNGDYYHPQYTTAPTFARDEPTYPGYAEPVPAEASQTVTAPEFVDLPEFEETAGQEPEAPALREITLPERPASALPEFTATRPEFQFDTLSVGFDFTDRAYSSELLTALRSTSGLWLAGTHPLMTTVWDALERAASERSIRMGARQQHWSRNTWLSNGWPTYEQNLDALDEEDAQKAQNARANVSRDTAIQKASFFVESWRAAIQSGVALEQVFITQWDQANERALEAATALVDFANAVLRLQIKEYAAKTKLFSADSAVLRAQIDAEEEKLSISRTEIEAEKLLGRIDADKIEAYEAQRIANEVLIDRYEARQQAWSAIEDQNQALNERFKGMVDALEESIAEYAAEWRIHRVKIGLQSSRAEFENTLLQAFAQQIQSATARIDGEKRKADISIEQLAAKFERAQLALLKHRADVRDAMARVSADTADEMVGWQRDRAAWGHIRASNQIESDKPRMVSEDTREQQQHIFQSLELAAQKHNLASQQGAIALNASTRAYAQIGSAAWSTINVHASAQGSVGSSWNFQNVYVS